MSAGKAIELQAQWHYVGKIDGGAGSLPDEEARPEPVGILRQKGIHPHPGPEWHQMSSILEDECWQQCGWPQPEECGVVISDDVTLQQDNLAAQHITVPDDDSDEPDE